MRCIASALALVVALTVTATPIGTAGPDAALLEVEIERNGKPVFSPRLLVRLGEMADASISSPTGESHRLVLSVDSLDEGAYHIRSLYLTKATPTANWMVQSEPGFTVRDAVPASMALVDNGGIERLRFGIRVRGGSREQMRELWARELEAGATNSTGR